MSKCHNNQDLLIKNLQNILNTLPLINHFKVHEAYNVSVLKDWYVQNRIKNDFFIIFIKSGLGKYVINGIEEKIHKNKIIFISNSVTHSFFADSKEPPSFISIHFGLHSNQSSKLVENLVEPFSFAFEPEMPEKLLMLFQDIFKYSKIDSVGNIENLSSGLLHYLFTQIYLHYINKGSNDNNVIKKLQNIKDMLDISPLNTLTVEQMAQSASISRKYFSSLFKKYYGKTPKEYQIYSKINHAKFLLEAESLSIKEIAYMCNFPDQYAFSKQFKKVTGSSPTETRHG